MSPIEHNISFENLNLVAYEWPGEGQPILFVHATGFHARVWNQVIKHLPGKHIFAIDLMGHGQSDTPPIPLTWRQYADNVIATVEQLKLKNIIGVGHSMGGFCITAAAAELPNHFSSIVLIDPVIFDPNSPRHTMQSKAEDLPIARRRNDFSSPEEMQKLLSAKKNFKLWDPEVLKDYCTYGLVKKTDGSNRYELACKPIVEAATYVAPDKRWIFEAIPKIDIPVTVIRARDRTPEDPPLSFGASPTYPKLATLFKHGKDIQLKEFSHFIPMEDPKLTAELILDSE